VFDQEEAGVISGLSIRFSGRKVSLKGAMIDKEHDVCSAAEQTERADLGCGISTIPHRTGRRILRDSDFPGTSSVPWQGNAEIEITENATAVVITPPPV
jgi:hypothetical protein